MITLHYFPTSHWSRAVHLALREAGVEYATTVVDITRNATFEPAYMAINPRGVVPTLQDGDETICDSRAIAEHLDARCGGALCRAGDAAVEAWIRRLHDFPVMLLSYSVWVLGARGENSKSILADKITRARDYAERHPDLREHYLRKAEFFAAFEREVYDEDHVAARSRACRAVLDELSTVVDGRDWIGGQARCFADCIAASILSRLIDLGRLDDWHATPDHPLRRYLDRLRSWAGYQYVFFEDPNIPKRLRLRQR